VTLWLRSLHRWDDVVVVVVVVVVVAVADMILIYFCVPLDLQKMILTLSAVVGTATFALTTYFYHRIPTVKYVI